MYRETPLDAGLAISCAQFLASIRHKRGLNCQKELEAIIRAEWLTNSSLKRYVDEALQQKDTMEFFSVGEKKPRVGQICLVKSSETIDKSIGIDYAIDEYSGEGYFYYHENVTHWRPVEGG